MKAATHLVGWMALSLLLACSSDDDGSPAGAAGNAGTSGGAGAAGTAGVGGTAGTSGGAGAAGSAGDARAQAALYAREDVACTQDSDCCVVFDTCVSEGYLVGAKDRAAVKALIDSAPDASCTDCIPPSIQASCGPSGTCVAAKIKCTSGPMFQDGMKDHCGSLELPPECTVKSQSVPWNPGMQTQTILGCGE